MSSDLSEAAVRDVLPRRPLRVYSALASTEADARAWARSHAPDGARVVDDDRARCRTLGRRVRAVFHPLGPLSRQVVGTAVDVNRSGALVIETEPGRRVAVHARGVGRLQPDGAGGG